MLEDTGAVDSEHEQFKGAYFLAAACDYSSEDSASMQTFVCGNPLVLDRPLNHLQVAGACLGTLDALASAVAHQPRTPRNRNTGRVITLTLSVCVLCAAQEEL